MNYIKLNNGINIPMLGLGTYNLTGIKYKAPIVLSEYLSIIMIPTGSTRGEKCEEECNWDGSEHCSKCHRNGACFLCYKKK